MGPKKVLGLRLAWYFLPDESDESDEWNECLFREQGVLDRPQAKLKPYPALQP